MTRAPRACIVRFQPLDLATRREAVALVAEGFGVDVLCLADPGEPKRERLDGYAIRRVTLRKLRGSKLRYGFEYLAWFCIGFSWLTVQHLRCPFAVIQVSTLPDTQVFATLVPRLLGAKVVVFLKEPTGELFETLYGSQRIARMMNRISDRGIRYAHLAFAVSEEHKATYVARGLPAAKIVAIPNAMPIEPLGVTIEDRCPDPDRFVVICHGTIEERWGHDTIVRAAAIARDDIPNLTVRFTGRGTYLDDVLRLVAELDLDDVVEYLGFLPFDALGKELMRAHVGVSAQKASAYSHVVQTGKMYEYLALGIPAIVTRLRSSAAYFSDGEVYFVEPDDPADLARALLELSRDPVRRDALAAAGLAAFEPYRWEVQAERYRDAIRSLWRTPSRKS